MPPPQLTRCFIPCQTGFSLPNHADDLIINLVMVDISKHIAYWRTGAEEDWQVACDLLAGGKTRHGLFFAHLALEKILKAHVCKVTGQLAPRIHNLIQLSEFSKLNFQSDHIDTLADMNAFNLEGRYPTISYSCPRGKEAQIFIDRCSEVLQWLIRQL